MDTRPTLDTLPEDPLLFGIIPWLLPEDLLIFALTSKFFLRLAHDQALWKNRFKVHFPHVLHALQYLKKDTHDWRRLFWQTYRVEYKKLPDDQARLFSLGKEGFVSTFLRELQTIKENYKGNRLTGAYGELEPIIEDSHETWARSWLRQTSYEGDESIFFPDGFVFNPQDKCSLDILMENIRYQFESLNLLPPTNQDQFKLGMQMAEFHSLKLPMLDISDKLLANNPSLINQYDVFDTTPLMRAAKDGSWYVVEYLLSKGADLSLQTNAFNGAYPRGMTAFHFAAENKQDDILLMLLRHAILNLTSDRHYERFMREVLIKVPYYNLQMKTIWIWQLENFICHFDQTSKTRFAFFSFFKPANSQILEAAKCLRMVALFGEDASSLQLHHDVLLSVEGLKYLYEGLRTHVPNQAFGL